MKRLTLLLVVVLCVCLFAPGAAGWPPTRPSWKVQPPWFHLGVKPAEEVTVEELFRMADRVVLGEVTGVEVRRVSRDPREAPEDLPKRIPVMWEYIATCVTIVPEETFKGESVDSKIEVRVPGGTLDNVRLADGRLGSERHSFNISGGTPSFRTGQRVLLFLRAKPSYLEMLVGARSQFIVDGDMIYSVELGQGRSSAPLAPFLERIRQLAEGGQR